MEKTTNETTEVIGVRFKEDGKTYYFDACHKKAKSGDYAIVETSRGLEFGKVFTANQNVPNGTLVLPLRPFVRVASEYDIKQNEVNHKKEKEALKLCEEKIKARGLDMKLIEAEYTFDTSKLTFYFSAEGRVDFRELLKDLATCFHTRIELRQIGIRDEAKLLGGLGLCGRPFCCATFLPDFAQVSIKMAKEQNLSLNSSKISGACGRLMCCLKFEHETYQAELKELPPIDAFVKTPDGTGNVCEVAVVKGLVKVKINEAVKTYKKEDVKIISLPKKKKEEE